MKLSRHHLGQIRRMLGLWASVAGDYLNGANRRFTGSYEAASFSRNAFPRVSWFNDNPSQIDLSNWTHSVTGISDAAAHTLGDLEPDRRRDHSTIDRTGGWLSTQHWRGVRLSRLIDDISPNESARNVTVRSVTGYYRRFSLDDAREFVLAKNLVEKPCPTATVTLSGWWRPVGAVSSGSGGLQKLRQIQHQAGSSLSCPSSNDHSESLQLIMAAGACSGGHYREIIDLRSSITKA